MYVKYIIFSFQHFLNGARILFKKSLLQNEKHE